MVIEQDVHVNQFEIEMPNFSHAPPNVQGSLIQNSNSRFPDWTNNLSSQNDINNRPLFTDQIHSHCATCIRPRKCIQLPVAFRNADLSQEEKYSIVLDVHYHNNLFENYCPVVRCTNRKCQTVMHYCKMQEHFLLCPFETVPCINSNYGCPHLILRGQISNHLSQHCPANVVHCSAEWNRWPLHTSTKSPPTQIFCSPHSLNIHNLDVALALRDQRMLKQLWSSSRQLKKTLRGHLSTHPAVPIKPYIGIRTFREFRKTKNVSDDAHSLNVHCDNIDEEKYINFAAKLVENAYKESLVEIIRRSANHFRKIYNEFCTDNRQSRKKSNSICPVLMSNQNRSNNNLILPLSLGLSSSINLPVLADLEKQMLAASTDVFDESKSSTIPSPPPVPKCNALSLEISIRSYAFYQPKPKAMYTFRCGMDFRKDELAAHSRDIHSDIHGGLDGWIEHRCPLFQYGCSFVHRRLWPLSAFDIENSSRSILIYNESLETFACRSSEDSLQKSKKSITFNDQMSISSTNSSINNYDDSIDFDYSSNDYDFKMLNGDSYRRDSSLFENCPKSLLTTEIHHSNVSDSFDQTLSSSRLSSKNSLLIASQPIITFNNLPFEILQNICNYLDGLSLNNLSFTSKRMRNLVQSFVKKKGYVVLQWKRFETEKNKFKWLVVRKKWLFSNAMHSIKKWELDPINVMAKHLQNCPFYDRNIRTEPFRIVPLESIQEKLKLNAQC
ncbi:F-box domain containing protein 2 [Sarcoptes scabiei]|uniref:F-box domain containing protein 2 n=1 Tax=Sarcoptes scabiei TaxID=52283 RepID=A0A132A6W7_SARSC|nr:F-box domain containing protein 2 [Sarcoptes scabiei]